MFIGINVYLNYIKLYKTIALFSITHLNTTKHKIQKMNRTNNIWSIFKQYSLSY